MSAKPTERITRFANTSVPNVENLEKVLAIELLCAAQALDLRRPLKSSPVLEQCHALVRQHISYAESDRIFATDIETAHKIIASGALAQMGNLATGIGE